MKGDQEGLICQSDDGLVYKIKNRQYLGAVVVGFTEAQPDPKKGLEAGMVDSLLTALMRPDGSLQLLTEVGSGLTNALRRTSSKCSLRTSKNRCSSPPTKTTISFMADFHLIFVR